MHKKLRGVRGFDVNYFGGDDAVAKTGRTKIFHGWQTISEPERFDIMELVDPEAVFQARILLRQLGVD